jgi:hypothetical protein
MSKVIINVSLSSLANKTNRETEKKFGKKKKSVAEQHYAQAEYHSNQLKAAILSGKPEEAAEHFKLANEHGEKARIAKRAERA